MKRERKEAIKKLVKRAGLYTPAVILHKMLFSMKANTRDLSSCLASPFRNHWFLLRGTWDGLPFPPARLVHLVTNTYNCEWFYMSGVTGAQCIREILIRNEFHWNDFTSVLDFGCGCGRVIRHWKSLGARLCGTDYNPLLIEWCRQNLPFAEFTCNAPISKLPYADGKFDFIYAISVFTHLTEESGKFWMRELTRVLRPGGVMYITFMGTTRVPNLPLHLREQFESGQIVVTDQEYEMRNECAAYHPEEYVRQHLTKGLRVVDFVPGGARDANQDVFLLQKNHCGDLHCNVPTTGTVRGQVLPKQ